MSKTPERQPLVRLRQLLAMRFNEGELETLCFDLGISYDALPGRGTQNKARELVAYAERHACISELVRIARQHRPDISWDDELEWINHGSREPDELLPSIRDPLSLLDRCDSNRPVPSSVMREIAEARAHSDLDEVIRICKDALTAKWIWNECRAIIQLYLADAQAQVGHIEKAITDAESARIVFEMQDDSWKQLVTHLLLARFKARQDLMDGHREYDKAIKACQKLEFQAKASGSMKEAQFCGRLVEAIQRIQENIENADWEERSRSCPLNSIPILQLADGPEKLTEPSEMIGYLATDRFHVERLEETFTYVPYPIDAAVERRKLGLEVGTVHFALPVPVNGWPCPVSTQEDLALVQAQITQEGPGVLWTGRKWNIGRFERDEHTGTIDFVTSRRRRHIIGGEITETQKVSEIEYGSVIGLLKAKRHAEWFPSVQ